MGGCASKPPRRNPYSLPEQPNTPENDHRQEDDGEPSFAGKTSPFYSLSPIRSFISNKKSPARPSSDTSTPKAALFPPPSPAKHIMAVLMKRRRRKEDGSEVVDGLDKRFGLSKRFRDQYDIGDEVGRGHFGYTISATCKSGDHTGEKVAVKVIPKAKMTTAIAIEDVRRELRILHELSGHGINLIQFYDAFEDIDHVYIVMELCEGGELLDLILTRGGKFTEDESKNLIVQILNAVAFCHLQGVVHRDLKPENFLLKTKEDDLQLKAIDFGLSDFVKPDEKLNDIVGSAYYVAPEVLLRSYDTEADVWSVGVISYILMCGSRPFWARTESGIFRAVLKTVPSFNETAWSLQSPLAKCFVKDLLNKDPRKRLTVAQALCHPWIRDHKGVEAPIDIRVIRSLKAYTLSSPLRKAALRALSKTLCIDDLFYLKKQFIHIEKSERVTVESIRMALMKHATNAMKESRIIDYLKWLTALDLDFSGFCAGAINVYQLEALDCWEEQAHSAYEIFENDGNRAIIIEELASELGLGPTVPLHVVVGEWIRHSDGKLSFLGFLKLLHGISTRNHRRLR